MISNYTNQPTNQLTNQLIPCSRVFLEKPTVTRLVKKCPHLIWDMKVHYCVHKNLTLIPVLNEMGPVHTFSPYFSKIHSNIIFPSTPTSLKWSLPFRILHAFQISPMHATRSAILLCFFPKSTL